jgi:hypothetical protein
VIETWERKSGWAISDVHHERTQEAESHRESRIRVQRTLCVCAESLPVDVPVALVCLVGEDGRQAQGEGVLLR